MISYIEIERDEKISKNRLNRIGFRATHLYSSTFVSAFPRESVAIFRGNGWASIADTNFERVRAEIWFFKRLSCRSGLKARLVLERSAKSWVAAVARDKWSFRGRRKEPLLLSFAAMTQHFAFRCAKIFDLLWSRSLLPHVRSSSSASEVKNTF